MSWENHDELRPTEGQKNLLRALGVSDAAISRLSKNEAKFEIDARLQRAREIGKLRKTPLPKAKSKG